MKWHHIFKKDKTPTFLLAGHRISLCKCSFNLCPWCPITECMGHHGHKHNGSSHKAWHSLPDEDSYDRATCDALLDSSIEKCSDLIMVPRGYAWRPECTGSSWLIYQFCNLQKHLVRCTQKLGYNERVKLLADSLYDRVEELTWNIALYEKSWNVVERQKKFFNTNFSEMLAYSYGLNR